MLDIENRLKEKMEAFLAEVRPYPHFSKIQDMMAQAQEKIGYHFQDISYLMLAFCRTKVDLAIGKHNKTYKNDTLAQLGDAVLDLIVIEEGMAQGLQKGKIDQQRQALLNNLSFHSETDERNFGQYCYHETHFYDDAPEEKKVAVSSHDSVIEAITGAIYLDGGMEAARKWFVKISATDKNDQPTVQIRKWQLADAADLAKLLSNQKVQDRLRDGLPYPYTEEDGQDYIMAMLDADENDTFAFAVVLNEKVIGNVAAFRGNNIHNKTAELGYYLAEECWGQGRMTEAVNLLCDHIFKTTDIMRIYAEPFADNIGSCRVLEKAGFQCEGILRSNAVKNGRIMDMKMYAKVRQTDI